MRQLVSSRFFANAPQVFRIYLEITARIGIFPTEVDCAIIKCGHCLEGKLTAAAIHQFGQ